MAAPSGAMYACRPAGYDPSDEEFDEDEDDEYLISYAPPSGAGLPRLAPTSGFNEPPPEPKDGPITVTSNGYGPVIRKPSIPKFTWLRGLEPTRTGPPPVRVKVSGTSESGWKQCAVVLQDDLRVAVTLGNVKVIEEFLDAETSVNSDLGSGLTALWHAASSAQPTSVGFLLQRGAEPNSPLTKLFPILTAACSSACVDDERVLDCLRQLITAGADLSAVDKLGMTALMHAALSHRRALVTELITHGAALDTQDDKGYTALLWAVEEGHAGVVRALLGAGAEARRASQDGTTALGLAALSGHREIEMMIQSYLADPGSVRAMDGGEEEFSSAVDGRGLSTAFSAYCFSPDVLTTFLSVLELTDLLPVLRRENVTLERFLRFTDNDLLRLGVQQLPLRKKVIDALKEAHRRTWETSSLTDINYMKKVSCADAAALVGNVQRHAALITSTVAYISDQLRADPCILTPNPAPPGGGGPAGDAGSVACVNQLCANAEETLTNVSNLYKELLLLRARLNQICRQRIYGQPDLIVVDNLVPCPSLGDQGSSLVSVALGLGLMIAAWGAWTHKDAITARLQLIG